MDVQKDHLDGDEEGFMPDHIVKARIWKPRSSHVCDLDWSSASAMLPARTQGIQSRVKKILLRSKVYLAERIIDFG